MQIQGPARKEILGPARLRQTACFLADFAELGRPLLFQDPRRVLTAWRPGEVKPLLEAAETAAREGAWVAGFVGYEAAAAFDLPVNPPEADFPLAWFAVFEDGVPICWPGGGDSAAADASGRFAPGGGPGVRPAISQARFEGDLAVIRELIRAGETYQVNYTFDASLPAARDPAALFLELQPARRHPYGAWLHQPPLENRPGWSIASLSPELFLCRTGHRLETGPIKGTRPRAADPARDQRRRLELRASAKDRAEHIMIVDMARNDLGRICQVGSIAAPELAAWRAFSSIQHLESRVTGLARDGVGLAEQFAALFPAASITGAPKHRTMEIIRQLEGRPRGVYTGAIGVIRPGGDYIFNVAIRTVRQMGPTAPRVGLGGGVVYDSDAASEWREAAAKGRFLDETVEAPGLIETMLIEARGEIPLLAAHLNRLGNSAEALGLALDQARARERVRQAAQALVQAGHAPWVLRLLLRPNGEMVLSDRAPGPVPGLVPGAEAVGIREGEGGAKAAPAGGKRLDGDLNDQGPIGGERVEARPNGLPQGGRGRLIVELSPWRVDGRDRLLRHKTTRRTLFDAALAGARRRGRDEALLRNDAGRVTEGAIRSLLARIDGRWYAPPVTDGLLPGVWRGAEMIRLAARERSLTLEDLLEADRIRMGNAVQGGLAVVRLVDAAGQTLWTAPDTATIQEPFHAGPLSR